MKILKLESMITFLPKRYLVDGITFLVDVVNGASGKMPSQSTMFLDLVTCSSISITSLYSKCYND